MKTKGDPTRARALAEAAERGLEPYPFLNETRRAIERWVETTF